MRLQNGRERSDHRIGVPPERQAIAHARSGPGQFTEKRRRYILETDQAYGTPPRLECQLEPLISHRIPFEDAAEAYRLVDTQPHQTVQVVLTYGV